MARAMGGWPPVALDAAGPTSRQWVRLVLVVGIVAGLLNAAELARVQPEQVGIATDVYAHAASRALAGEGLYATSPPGHPGYHFTYPPVVVLAFLPLALVDQPAAAYALATALNVVTAGALGVVMCRVVASAGVDLAAIDRGLVVGYAGASAGAASTILQGQVNLQLALAIAVGVLLVERGREAAGGAAIGLAASVKLFPALVGVWLLRRRAWRAVLAATAAGVGLALASLAAFGLEGLDAWLTVALPREAAVGTFADGPNPGSSLLTIRRQLSVVAPWLPAAWLLPAGGAILAPVVLATYRTFETLRSRLVALQATVLAMLVVLPLEPFYLSLAMFPMVPLLYLIEPSAPTVRRLFLAGTLVASIPVWLSTVEAWVAAVPLPPGLSAALLDLAEGLFAFALPQMVGVWLLLAACVFYQHRAVTGPATGAAESARAV